MCDLWMVGGVRGGAVGGRVLAGAWVTFGLWAGGGRWDGVRGVAVGGVGVGGGRGREKACPRRLLDAAKKADRPTVRPFHRHALLDATAVRDARTC